MSERYFEKFPIITYANTQAVDITERVIFSDNTIKNPYVFYPYDLEHHERPDQFSNRYYGDSYYSWLLYLSNNITDPYYEWYLTQEEFLQFLEKKYGSVELASNKIKFYRNNWPSASDISVDYYNSLPSNVALNYWEANYNSVGNAVSYSRKKDDTIINTNHIICYNVSNTSFIKDEIVTVHFDSSHIGHGQISSMTSNSICIQHTSGVTNYSVSGSSYLYGQESNVNTAITLVKFTTDSLETNEESYYSPITYYEYENEKNEYYKSIRVLDSKYARQMALQLKGLLK